MRTLVLFRGAPGCGKSTFINNNNLRPYALCADDIRLLCASPQLDIYGKKCISQQNDKIVWKILFDILEVRMQAGEFTVIDATNSKTVEMNKYKELADKYRYRMYCIDMTDLPIEECKKRNANREPLKQVPPAVIDKFYSRFATQKVPSGIKVIKPDELDKVFFKSIDLSHYKKIHHIGDIHGCYTVLKEYIKEIKEDEFYIFTGDYIDRGIENVEVINYLLSIKDLPNVLLLEGNHERWIWKYANNEEIKSPEFKNVTAIQFDNAAIDKKSLRQLYRKLGQCAYYTYNDKEILVTHAGLSTTRTNLSFIATKQMIHGVGGYNDFEEVANSFNRTSHINEYQIHGHRNTKQLPIEVNDAVFNLEGRVEFGGCLRCVDLDENGFTCIEIQNTIFRKEKQVNHEELTVSGMVYQMRESKYIQEKKFDNISSFNFTPQAFYDKIWNEQTVKARGLYIDTEINEIVARGYVKFFNINEREETKLENLPNKLQFPITAYVKENGYLGLIGYDNKKDDLFITTKSNPEGDYAQWFKEIFFNNTTDEIREQIKQYIKDNKVTFAFECVDMERDPHIIEYDKTQLFLLDVIYNTIDFKKYNYEDMCSIANKFNLKHKEKACVLNTWQEFYDWYIKITSEDYLYNNRHIEGFVIEDNNNYMVKVKLAYYNFWKFMRSIAHETIRKGYCERTSALTTKTANLFYGWLKNKVEQTEDKNTIPRTAVELRKMFYQDNPNLVI